MIEDANDRAFTPKVLSNIKWYQTQYIFRIEFNYLELWLNHNLTIKQNFHWLLFLSELICHILQCIIITGIRCCNYSHHSFKKNVSFFLLLTEKTKIYIFKLLTLPAPIPSLPYRLSHPLTGSVEWEIAPAADGGDASSDFQRAPWPTMAPQLGGWSWSVTHRQD